MGIDIRDLEQPVGTLSGGERQAVAIARAVYFGAKVLILDEPTSALGVRQSGVVLKYILQARERGHRGRVHHPQPAPRAHGRRPLLPAQPRPDDQRVRARRRSLARSSSRRCPEAPSSRRWPTSSRSPASDVCRPTRPEKRMTTRKRSHGDRSRSASSAPDGWVTCTHGPTSGWPSTGRTWRCARSSWPWPTRRAAAAETFARAHGGAAYADWRDLLADPDLAAVSVTAPNFLHREIGVAVAEAGKHLWIEKPVGLTAADAIAVRDAVHANGVVDCVGFNYRHVPAVARRPADRRVGRDRRTYARAGAAPHRLRRPPGQPAVVALRRRDRGGHGALGDLASHGVDLLRFVLGDVTGVMAQTAIHIPQRPVARTPPGTTRCSTSTIPGSSFGEVENEDYVVAILRMASGALAVCEANRAAVGEQNNYAFEVHGTKGLVRWDFRRPGELQVSAGDQYAGQPTSTVFSEPGDGEYAAFQPGAGIAMGYDDTKVVEAHNFLRAICGRGRRARDPGRCRGLRERPRRDGRLPRHRRVGSRMSRLDQGRGLRRRHGPGAAAPPDRRDRLRPDRPDARLAAGPRGAGLGRGRRGGRRAGGGRGRLRRDRRAGHGRSRSCWPPTTSTRSRSARAPTPTST